MSAADHLPEAIVIDRTKAIRYAAVGVVVLVLVVIVLAKAFTPDPKTVAVPVAPQAATEAAPETTPTTLERLNPLANFGPLNPTAAALVGESFEARRELARRVSDGQLRWGVSHCGLFLGATSAGEWELTGGWSAGYPVPIFAGCPPPVPPSTTTTVAPAPTAPTTGG